MPLARALAVIEGCAGQAHIRHQSSNASPDGIGERGLLCRLQWIDISASANKGQANQ